MFGIKQNINIGVSNQTNKAMKDFKITSEQFLNYLESLGLFRIKIEIKETGAEAVVSSTSAPSIGDFTQISRNENGGFWVRLSNKDYLNRAITDGFFDSYAADQLVREYLADPNCRPFDWVKTAQTTEAVERKFLEKVSKLQSVK